jgi:hypothetical protein
VKLVAAARPRVAIPAHYDGWSHFRDGEAGMRTAVRLAAPDLRARFRWLPDGEPLDLAEELNPPLHSKGPDHGHS